MRIRSHSRDRRSSASWFLHTLLASILFGAAVEVLFLPWRLDKSHSWIPIQPFLGTESLAASTIRRALIGRSKIPVIHICRFVFVQALSPACHTSQKSVLNSSCIWHVLVTSSFRKHPHILRPPLSPRSAIPLPVSSTSPQLLPSEQSMLIRLEGCSSEASCNTSTQCTYGTEDPSDALWLRAYSLTSKFVVLLNVGVTTLAFFLTAIVIDGSIFYPHRPGLADASASALIMLSLASLLYILIVPPELQFALHGKGSFQTIAYVFSVCLLAVLLPAIAIIWLGTIIFVIYLVGFLLEYSILLVIASLHLFLVLVVYQIECTALHVRLVYFANDETDEVEHERQLFSVGAKLLSRVRNNLLFSRLLRVVEDRALQVIRNHIPDRLAGQFLQQNVPQISMDGLDDIDVPSDTNNFNATQPPPSSSLHPVASPPSHVHNRNTSVTESSPLLQPRNGS